MVVLVATLGACTILGVSCLLLPGLEVVRPLGAVELSTVHIKYNSVKLLGASNCSGVCALTRRARCAPAVVARMAPSLTIRLNGGAMLEVEGVSSFYGPIQALRDVSLRVDAGEAVAVLGPNGAGKSTLLRTISGLVKPRKGSIRFDGREIAGLRPDAIVKLGVAHVPEGRRIFARMTVMENLIMGAYTNNDSSSIKEDLDFVFSLFPDLAEKTGQMGGELSGGQQQMLAIGRAFMSRPSLLLMDEPSMGLAPILVERLRELGDRLVDIRERLGMAILLVEQNADLAIGMVNRVYLMQTGRIILSASSDEISFEDLHKAYLGALAGSARPKSQTEEG